MKVYLATSGEYSDYKVCHAFAREEDAASYALGDSVLELELRDGPVEVRTEYNLLWNPDLGDREASSMAAANPYESSWPEDFTGNERDVSHAWKGPPEYPAMMGPVLMVKGWDRERVRKVYSEQRAQYLASH